MRWIYALNMATYRAEAIVIKQIDFEEASKIITLFTRYQGKVKAIAKGVRRITSVKTGALELLNHIKLSLVEGRDLDLVSEVEVIKSYHRLSSFLVKAKVAYKLCELVDCLTPERQKSPEVFRLLKDGLDTLDSHLGKVEPIGICFQLRLLRQAGYWPDPIPVEDESLRQLTARVLEVSITRLNPEIASAQLWSRLSRLVNNQLLEAIDYQLKTDRVFLEQGEGNLVG